MRLPLVTICNFNPVIYSFAPGQFTTETQRLTEKSNTEKKRIVAKRAQYLATFAPPIYSCLISVSLCVSG